MPGLPSTYLLKPLSLHALLLLSKLLRHADQPSQTDESLLQGARGASLRAWRATQAAPPQRGLALAGVFTGPGQPDHRRTTDSSLSSKLVTVRHAALTRSSWLSR